MAFNSVTIPTRALLNFRLKDSRVWKVADDIDPPETRLGSLVSQPEERARGGGEEASRNEVVNFFQFFVPS